MVSHHQGSSLVHLIKEVTEKTWRAIDHHNAELERKDDRDSMEFKCRFWWVVQGNDLVGRLG